MDELVRTAIVALSAGLLFTVNLRVARDWHQWNRRERVVRCALNAYLAIIGYGTAEAMSLGVELGPRVFLVLLTHISFGVALYLTRNDPATARSNP